VGIALEPLGLFHVDERIAVGKKIVAGDRTIWPVQRMSIWRTLGDRIQAIRITPLAMLIIEPDEQYALSFGGELMTVETILEIAPTLVEALREARTGRKIVVGQAEADGGE
jgi:hypothetical protein